MSDQPQQETKTTSIPPRFLESLSGKRIGGRPRRREGTEASNASIAEARERIARTRGAGGQAVSTKELLEALRANTAALADNTATLREVYDLGPQDTAPAASVHADGAEVPEATSAGAGDEAAQGEENDSAASDASEES